MLSEYIKKELQSVGKPGGTYTANNVVIVKKYIQNHIDNCPICREFPEPSRPKQDIRYPPGGKTYVGGIWVSNRGFIPDGAPRYRCRKRNKLCENFVEIKEHGKIRGVGLTLLIDAYTAHEAGGF